MVKTYWKGSGKVGPKSECGVLVTSEGNAFRYDPYNGANESSGREMFFFRTSTISSQEPVLYSGIGVIGKRIVRVLHAP